MKGIFLEEWYDANTSIKKIEPALTTCCYAEWQDV